MSNDPEGDEIIRRAREMRGKQGPSIPLPKLVTMFREAARRGPCPDEQVLGDFQILHSCGWVKRLIAAERELTRTNDREKAAAVKALSVLQASLPAIIRENRLSVQWKPNEFGHSVHVEPLDLLSRLIPDALTAIGSFERGTRKEYWHAPAELHADEAIKAWRKAGRMRFGTNPESPLTRFVEAFLALAGEHHSLAAISGAFSRGMIAGVAKRGTTTKS